MADPRQIPGRLQSDGVVGGVVLDDGGGGCGIVAMVAMPRQILEQIPRQIQIQFRGRMLRRTQRQIFWQISRQTPMADALAIQGRCLGRCRADP